MISIYYKRTGEALGSLIRNDAREPGRRRGGRRVAFIGEREVGFTVGNERRVSGSDGFFDQCSQPFVGDFEPNPYRFSGSRQERHLVVDRQSVFRQADSKRRRSGWKRKHESSRLVRRDLEIRRRRRCLRRAIGWTAVDVELCSNGTARKIGDFNETTVLRVAMSSCCIDQRDVGLRFPEAAPQQAAFLNLEIGRMVSPYENATSLAGDPKAERDRTFEIGARRKAVPVPEKLCRG